MHLHNNQMNVIQTINFSEYGMGERVSIMGDVYSFGILLLEIFTGKKPTDKLFQENLNLHHFVKITLPDRAMTFWTTQHYVKKRQGKLKHGTKDGKT